MWLCSIYDNNINNDLQIYNTLNKYENNDVNIAIFELDITMLLFDNTNIIDHSVNCTIVHDRIITLNANIESTTMQDIYL